MGDRLKLFLLYIHHLSYVRFRCVKIPRMDRALTPEGKEVIVHSKGALVEYKQIRSVDDGINTLDSFPLSQSGKIHDGACHEPNLAHSTACGERHAIAEMILLENYTIRDFYPLPYEALECLWNNWQLKYL
jgi:hypothetical protein